MCCLAARFLENEEDLAAFFPYLNNASAERFRTAREQIEQHYYDRARRRIQDDDYRSDITTVQALLLLSKRDNGCGRMLHCWQLVGSATRMVIDLGLHRKASLVCRGKDTTYGHIETRRRVFWQTYIMDKCALHFFGDLATALANLPCFAGMRQRRLEGQFSCEKKTLMCCYHLRWLLTNLTDGSDTIRTRSQGSCRPRTGPSRRTMHSPGSRSYFSQSSTMSIQQGPGRTTLRSHLGQESSSAMSCSGSSMASSAPGRALSPTIYSGHPMIPPVRLLCLISFFYTL